MRAVSWRVYAAKDTAMTEDFIRLVRFKFGSDFTLGKLFLAGSFFGYTCEDTDRHLELGGEKLYGKTAIPRGRYQVVVSYSNRFKREMPELLLVRYFTGVRIHGGNDAADTLGCPLLGAELTDTGVRNCGPINSYLMDMLHAELRHGPAFITVE